jgi:2-methylcitrate dehydratase PrpD
MIQERLADYVASLAESELPPEVVAAAKRVVIDWFAALLPGGVLPPATLLVEALAEELDRGGGRLWPSGRTAPVRTAALINGAASHTIEFDDIFREALYHPGTVVIPAALAAAEARGVGGAGFLRAVVAGYEVSNRIGIAVNPAHYAYWHTTATVGHFGAAAAAASVLGLDAGRAAHALANAATMAAGLQQAFRTEAMSKPLHVGQAAANGLLAALAAEAGVTGAEEMIEGARGFGKAMSDGPDWDAALADLGTRYTIIETTQKNHASCGHGHAAIDAVLALQDRHGLAPADVARITVGTYGPAVEITNIPEPAGMLDCKLSTPYCLAAALMVGSVRGEAFSPRWMEDPGLRALAARVQMGVDEQAHAAFPNRRGAIVEVETTSGARHTERRPTRKGDPDDPLSDAEVIDKYRELAHPVIGEPAGEALLAALRDLEALDHMAALPLPAPKPAVRAAGD